MAISPTNTKAKKIAAATIAAAALATGYEGTKYVPYQDPRPNDPIWTVCMGHTGNDIQRNKRYSKEECLQLLDNDMRNAVMVVERCHPDLPFNVLVAFSDAVYNIGPKVACSSTASKYLSQGNYDGACKELPKWAKSNGKELPGLVKRRNEEMERCLTHTSLSE